MGLIGVPEIEGFSLEDNTIRQMVTVADFSVFPRLKEITILQFSGGKIAFPRRTLTKLYMKKQFVKGFKAVTIDPTVTEDLASCTSLKSLEVDCFVPLSSFSNLTKLRISLNDEAMAKEVDGMTSGKLLDLRLDDFTRNGYFPDLNRFKDTLQSLTLANVPNNGTWKFSELKLKRLSLLADGGRTVDSFLPFIGMTSLTHVRLCVTPGPNSDISKQCYIGISELFNLEALHLTGEVDMEAFRIVIVKVLKQLRSFHFQYLATSHRPISELYLSEVLSELNPVLLQELVLMLDINEKHMEQIGRLVELEELVVMIGALSLVTDAWINPFKHLKKLKTLNLRRHPNVTFSYKNSFLVREDCNRSTGAVMTTEGIASVLNALPNLENAKLMSLWNRQEVTVEKVLALLSPSARVRLRLKIL